VLYVYLEYHHSWGRSRYLPPPSSLPVQRVQVDPGFPQTLGLFTGFANVHYKYTSAVSSASALVGLATLYGVECRGKKKNKQKTKLESRVWTSSAPSVLCGLVHFAHCNHLRHLTTGGLRTADVHVATQTLHCEWCNITPHVRNM